MVGDGGKTPEVTMYVQVIIEIKHHRKRGERPRFVCHGQGLIGLSQWERGGLYFQIKQHNQQVRKALRERLLAMKPPRVRGAYPTAASGDG